MNRFDRAQRLFTAVLAVAACLSAIGCSEETAAPAPPAAGPHPLQVVLDEYRAANNIVGLSAAVKTRGHDVWVGVSGLSHAAHPVTPEMLFRMGSVTKTYVAVVTVRLAEAGILSLDDRIVDWLPDVRQYPPNPDNIDSTITVRHLLNHTSGLYNYLDSNALAEDMDNDPTKIWEPEELLGYVYGPVFAPGEGFFYTNTGYVLLGMIVEKLTGRDSLSAVLDSLVFDVLGTGKTFLAGEKDEPDGSEIAHGWSLGREFDTDGWKPYYSVVWAAGDMTSTAKETAEFLSGVFDGVLVNESSLQQMKTTVHVRENFEYGLGLISTVLTSGRTVWGHSGLSTGFTTLVFHSPQDSTTVALLANDANAVLVPLMDELLDKNAQQ